MSKTQISLLFLAKTLCTTLVVLPEMPTLLKHFITFFTGCGLSEWQSSPEFNHAIGRSYDADPASIVHCQQLVQLQTVTDEQPKFCFNLTTTLFSLFSYYSFSKLNSWADYDDAKWTTPE